MYYSVQYDTFYHHFTDLNKAYGSIESFLARLGFSVSNVPAELENGHSVSAEMLRFCDQNPALEWLKSTAFLGPPRIPCQKGNACRSPRALALLQRSPPIIYKLQLNPTCPECTVPTFIYFSCISSNEYLFSHKEREIWPLPHPRCEVILQQPPPVASNPNPLSSPVTSFDLYRLNQRYRPSSTKWPVI